jgi:hypothetical protein
MVHEQNRQDRDDHIEFRCSMIKGFFGALMKAMADGMSKEEAVKKLCEDGQTMEKYDFAAKQYVKGAGVPNYKIDGPEFDFESIMLYSSTAYAANGMCHSDLKWCPIVKIKKENGVQVGIERIEPNLKPSKGDTEFVRKWYPWGG